MTIEGPKIHEEFPNEKLFNIAERPWFAEIANFKAVGALPDDLT